MELSWKTLVVVGVFSCDACYWVHRAVPQVFSICFHRSSHGLVMQVLHFPGHHYPLSLQCRLPQGCPQVVGTKLVWSRFVACHCHGFRDECCYNSRSCHNRCTRYGTPNHTSICTTVACNERPEGKTSQRLRSLRIWRSARHDDAGGDGFVVQERDQCHNAFTQRGRFFLPFVRRHWT